LIDHLPEHWKPYFRFAFCSGLRAGEQIALKPGDIDWEKGILHVRKAMTRDEDGKSVEGNTKNRYSRRTIKLIPALQEALKEQWAIYERFRGRYLFCTSSGARIGLDNLRDRVWTPVLGRANLTYREMKQTRRAFATMGLSCGENPLWITQVMGHRNTDMVINVYGKFIERARGTEDGGLLSQMFQGGLGDEQ
jgi:integrase